ncbi:uncharacterized protein METZ01_LOCUS109837 [marine metagenome]|uniref:Uncharacterized protein n=1 Tax=marine metagenome TaxID=408172 RepID=A0A381WYE8_9ZZZZ
MFSYSNHVCHQLGSAGRYGQIGTNGYKFNAPMKLLSVQPSALASDES